jgi:hypothetical protein
VVSGESNTECEEIAGDKSERLDTDRSIPTNFPPNRLCVNPKSPGIEKFVRYFRNPEGGTRSYKKPFAQEVRFVPAQVMMVHRNQEGAAGEADMATVGVDAVLVALAVGRGWVLRRTSKTCIIKIVCVAARKVILGREKKMNLTKRNLLGRGETR